ncbi:MAG: hypothetical protein WB630_10020 [Candidatus Acidiferrales bacterium]
MVLQRETDGTTSWLECPATIEEAKARVQKLATHSASEYIILNLQNGHKLSAKIEDLSEDSRWGVAIN